MLHSFSFHIINFDYIFLAVQSEIVFEHGEISKIIAIPIVNDLEAEKDESFAVELYDPTGGAQLGKHTKTVVTIINDDGNYFNFNNRYHYCFFY